MGLEDDLQPPGASAGNGGDAAAALEQRVSRLERELEALRRQIAGASAAAPAFVRVDAEARPAPPPPPMPRIFDEAAKPVPGIASAAWGAPTPPTSAHAVRDSRDSFENRLGSQIFNRISIVLLLIGTAMFLKYAVDRQWISDTGRVLAGLVAGAVIVLWSERFRQKGFAAFSYSLKALGSGVLYLSLWAAFHLYHLLPASVALALMLLVTAWNAYMAWAQNSELLAAYALAGGFATPMLLSTGGNHEAFLFTYLLAIDVATVALVRLRRWPRLLLGAFPLTSAFFIGWYFEFFAASELGLTAVFIALFAGTFSSVPVGSTGAEREAPTDRPRRTDRATLIEDILLPLANAAFLSLAFYSVLQDSGHHDLLPWLMLCLAAVYLGVMRLPQSRTASAIHLSIAVVFLTIAIPLKASGHWITVGWLVEGLALMWVATRLAPTSAPQDPAEAYASRTLRWLASAALLLGFCGVAGHCLGSSFDAAQPLFNSDTGTAVVGVVVFAVAAWLALKAVSEAESRMNDWAKAAMGAFVAIDLIALLLTLRELATFWFSTSSAYPHPPFQSGDFLTALLGLAVFACVIALSLRLARTYVEARFWTSCAALTTIAFNLVAVLIGMREIDAIWDVSAGSVQVNVDAALQQALAISGFLMLYGAVLLAVGFWKRSAFLRWQGLALLVFTIFKAFLYDMRNLSQGYRVVSFMALGALLMAISFAYQKDWLNLRAADAAESSADSSEAAR